MTIASATPLNALEAVVLDTETTGLDSRTARIVQVGAVRISRGSLLSGDRLDRLVNPGLPIPPETIAIHGITDARVADAPAFSALIDALDVLFARALLVGHSIAYDLAILEREYALANRPWRQPRALDIRVLARVVAPTLADHGLERLCEWSGVSIEGRHTALGDAMATANVFLALVPLLRAKGIRTVAEAEAASRRLAETESMTAGGFSTTADPGTSSIAPALQKVDSFPYRHRVRDVMTSPVEMAPLEMSVHAALDVMVRKRISSVLIGTPTGEIRIATERDILRAIHARGAAALAETVVSISNGPIDTVPADDFLYRAIGRIARMGYRHLGVHDSDGRLVGIVSTGNLMRHRSATALMLGDEIDAAASGAALATAWAKLPALVRSLMHEAVGPHQIAGVISAEICGITRRAAELAEQAMQAEGHGAPPVAYAVLVLGSAGRGESLLAADQDNAIVTAEGGGQGEAESATDRWFETLATHMNAILDTAGIPFCNGGVMAKNRAWRMSRADWRARIESWVTRQRPQDLLNVDIFFDAICVHGERALADDIWRYAFAQGHAARDFQALLTESARKPASPYNLLGQLRTDPDGRIDLKKFGLMPMFTSARVLAIRHDIETRSTPARLKGLVERGVASADVIDPIIEAQARILALMLAQQLADTEAGVPLSPRVVAASLTKTQRAELKSALGQVDEVIGLVSEGRL